MLGLFRKILSRSEAPQPARPAPAVRPPLPPPRLRSPVAPVRPVTVSPSPASTAITQAATNASREESVTNGTHVRVALAAIAATLPQSISHKLPANPDQFVIIPVEKIRPQLQYGQIVMTAAELRECSPEYFAALAGQDDLTIVLPLGDIVKQLSPEQFTRRKQRRVEVPIEVGPIFTPNAQGVTIAKPAVAQPSPTYRAQPTLTSTTAQAAPAPAAPASRISMSPQMLASLKAAAASPTASTPPAPAKPAVTPPRAMAPAPIPPVTPAPAPAPLPKKILPVVSKPEGELAIPLAAVCPEWPQEVRVQLTDVEIDQHQILVPLELLEPAMKSGRVLFTWAEVASWMQPPLAIPPTPKVGEMAVELPLKVIAPLFMGNQRTATQKRVAVDETIPDLFNGGSGSGRGKENSPRNGIPSTAPTPTSNPPVAKAPVTPPVARPAPPASTVSTPLPKAEPKISIAPAPEEISIEQVLGGAANRFGAKEIVNNTARLPGVAGALLVLSDGLLVTSSTPPAVRTSTERIVASVFSQRTPPRRVSLSMVTLPNA